MSEQSIGLKYQWRQFTLLVIVNGFVGAMVGLERTILPALAKTTFGIESHTAVLSFIVAFGMTKAAANYSAGRLANLYGRRALLLAGWWLALPVPVLLLYAPHWYWVIFANLLLGVSQGLAWSSAVVMKIDLVAPHERGLAMGLNEFAGYLAVGLMSFFTGYLATYYGLRPYPFYLGIGIAVTGLLLTVFWVKETKSLLPPATTTASRSGSQLFLDTTFRHKTLSSVTQAGLVNNLNDGMVWGLLPVFLASLGYQTATVGIIAALYPMIWGIGQLFTGKMSDHFNKKRMLFVGMLLQGLALVALPYERQMVSFIVISSLLGIGTALVYPTFLTVIADHSNPHDRAETIGIFRLWRDLGYAFGALLSGVIADAFGISMAILVTGFLTLGSAVVILVRMPESDVI